MEFLSSYMLRIGDMKSDVFVRFIISDIGNVDFSTFPRHVWVIPLLPSQFRAGAIEDWGSKKVSFRNTLELGDGFRGGVDDAEGGSDGLRSIICMILENRHEECGPLRVYRKISKSIDGALWAFGELEGLVKSMTARFTWRNGFRRRSFFDFVQPTVFGI